MRTPIAHTETYPDAATLKVGLSEKYPDKVFQVRKRKNGFTIVERTFPANKPEVTERRRSKKRGISF